MKEMTTGQAPILKVEGNVGKKTEWSYESLSRLPKADQVDDVSRLVSGMAGSGVRVRALLKESNPLPKADHITFHSLDGKFAASIPLQDAIENGILIYKRDGGPLPDSKGGPIRLIVPHGDNACGNVKSVIKMELTVGKGKDTTTGDPDHDNPEIHGHSHDHPHDHDHDHDHDHHDHSHKEQDHHDHGHDHGHDHHDHSH
jgi:DMSO/TMAO reductase YedYZ molybdopterin-dependent catalytic subunit